MSRPRISAVALLLLCFGLLLAGMPDNSLTFDEPSHLAAGYAAIARGQDGLWTMRHRGHPLLIDIWTALPLFVGEPSLPLQQLPGWRTDYELYVRSFIHEIAPLAVCEVAGRVPVALLTVLLGATVFRWGQDLTRGRGGWIAMALLLLDPNVLAHGRLATNDVGVTALGTLGLYLASRERPSAKGQPVLYGVVLGLACLAKSSGPLWLGSAGLYLIVLSIADRKRWSVHIRRAVAMGIAALVTIWAAYGFDVGPLTGDTILQVPAPEHWLSLLFQTGSADQRLSYALGRLRTGGWWWYFPLAWVLKTPVPLMLAALAGTIVALSQRQASRTLGLPALFAAAYLGAAIAIGPNIGYRHLLPLLPVAALLATRAFDALRATTPRLPAGRRGPRTAAALLVAALAWSALGVLINWPNEIAYFNELAGIAVGPARDLQAHKHELLISSNLDWGQSMKQMATYLKAETALSTYVAYSHPAPYDIPSDGTLPPHPEASPITSPLHPRSGRYLIGATSLHIPSSCCGLGLDGYAYFRNLPPSDTIDAAILVFDIAPGNQPRWLVQCGSPVVPLSRETVAAGFADYEQLRQVQLDCTQAWLYPVGPGVYAFRADDPGLTDAHVSTHTASARLSYKQPAGFVPEPFVLYEAQARPAAYRLTGAFAGEAGVPPNRQTTAVAGHVAFHQGFEFLGISSLPRSDNDGRAEDIVTWWRLTGSAPLEPISVMAHLVSADGANLAVADGLGITPQALVPSDVFAQRHSFDLPEGIEGEELWLRTGLYDLDDLSRWSVNDCSGCDAVFVPLAP